MQKLLDRATELLKDKQHAEALSVLEPLLSGDTGELEHRARAWRIASTAHEVMFELNAACDAMDKAEQLYLELGQDREACRIKLAGASQKLNLQHFREAGHRCEQAMVIARENKWLEQVGMAYELRASIHRHLTRHHEAVADFSRAEEIYRELGNQKLIDSMSMRIATSYYSIGRPELAKPYYERGTTYHLENQNFFTSIMHRVHVIAAAWMSRQYDSAEVLICELEADVEGKSNEFLDAFIQQCYGLMRLASGRFKDARKHLLKCYHCIEQGSNFRFKVAILTALAIIELRMDQPREALGYIESSRSNCMDDEDIETRLLDYYEPIILLANDRHELASGQWSRRQQIDWTTEMSLEYDWMAGMLEHIKRPEYKRVAKLSDESLAMADQWLAEIHGMEQAGRDNLERVYTEQLRLVSQEARTR